MNLLDRLRSCMTLEPDQVLGKSLRAWAQYEPGLLLEVGFGTMNFSLGPGLRDRTWARSSSTGYWLTIQIITGLYQKS